jgi:hypothetical protein
MKSLDDIDRKSTVEDYYRIIGLTPHLSASHEKDGANYTNRWRSIWGDTLLNFNDPAKFHF